VVEEHLDVLGRPLAVVLVELEVAVAPVDRPETGRLREAQACNREPRVLADAVPRGPDLHDVDVAVGDVGLNLDLIPQVLGHTLPSPEADALQIGLGKRHHTFHSVGGQGTSIQRRGTPSGLGRQGRESSILLWTPTHPIPYEAP
jgi:hypothetical protein